MQYLVDLEVVGHAHQRAELHAKLVLALRHLVVVLLDRHAHLAHGREHLGTQIAFGIDRRDREIAALDDRPMAHVAFGVVLERRLRPLLAVDLVDPIVAANAELHAVEDEELGLGPDEGGVADATRLQELLGLLRGRAGVAVVGLASGRLDDVADQDQARLGGKRVHHRGLGVRQQDHVRLVDRFPAGDRGAVEHDAVAKHLLVDGGDVLRRVLPFPARVGEPQIDIFDGVLLQHLHHLADAVAVPVAWPLRHPSCPQSCRARHPVCARRRADAWISLDRSA